MPRDYAMVSDVERMVGDLVAGRKFMDADDTNGINLPATSPSKSEVQAALDRAEGTLNGILEANGYASPVSSVNRSALDWIKEVHAALVSARLMNVVPVRSQEVFSDGTNSPFTRRTQTYENQVTEWKYAVENGRFPATRLATQNNVNFLAPTRERVVTRDESP